FFDYLPAVGVLTFSPGEVSKTFTVLIIDDTVVESNETVNLNLGSTTFGATLGTPNTAVLTIIDNDGSGSPHRPSRHSGGQNTPVLGQDEMSPEPARAVSFVIAQGALAVDGLQEPSAVLPQWSALGATAAAALPPSDLHPNHVDALFDSQFQ